MAHTPTKLTDEQRAAVIDQLQSALAEQGIELYSGAQKLKSWIDTLYPNVVAAQSRETLEDLLSSFTMEHAEQAANFILLLAAIPKLINEALTVGIKQAAAEIPVPSGPPRKATVDVRRAVINQVATLHAKSIAIGDAYLRTAQTHNLSKRSVQRIWCARREMAEQPYQNLQDVWTFFSSR